MTRLGVGAIEWPRVAALCHGRTGCVIVGAWILRSVPAHARARTRAEIELEQILNLLA